MAETYDFEAIFEIYSKQQQHLEQKQQELQSIQAEFDEFYAMYSQQAKETEDERDKLNSLRLEFCQIFQESTEIYKENEASTKELSEKQSLYKNLQKKFTDGLENQSHAVKNSNDLLQALQAQFQPNALTKEMETYENDALANFELNKKEYESLLKQETSVPEYRTIGLLKIINNRVYEKKKLSDIKKEEEKLLRDIQEIKKNNEELEKLL
ncbi:interaptin-like [Cylas formicarius]|uniref:interaptin-like n=1 Tax=Cylas formicarius TaxID=197179 RepID=UPI0029588159|nr:interaptin-like [Cylas formicarius]